VELEGDGDRVQLCIRDDGVGFDPAAGAELVRNGHFGLVAMRERVEMAGGRFQLESRPGAGVAVRAMFRMPLAS
jgi:signal transduction histidine kinase